MTRLAHRLLCRLLPSKFRTHHGPEMESVFLSAMVAARRRGWRATTSLWVREIGDIVKTAQRLRHTPVMSLRVSRGRGTGIAAGFCDDLRFAGKSLARAWALTLFAGFTLALGVGGATAMYGAVESIILNPLPYEAGNRMVGVWERIGTTGEMFVGAPREARETWAEQTDLFEHFEPFSFRFMESGGESGGELVHAALVRPGFFDLLGRNPIAGRTFDTRELTGEGLQVVLLNEGYWQRALGGRPDVVGTSIKLDGSDWTVIGVMPADAHVPSWGIRKVDVWRPLTTALIAEAMPSSAVLKPGVTTEVANRRFREMAARDPDPKAPVGYAALAGNQIGAEVRDYLGLPMAAAALLLLIACVNVSSLLVSRADERQRETAVQSALGAGRARLARQLLAEGSLLALAAGLAGVGVAHLIRSAIVALRPAQLAVLDQVTIGGRVLWFALGSTAAAALLLGCLPLWRLRRRDSLALLRSGDRTDGSRTDRRVRWTLITAEVALSFALVLGSLSVFGTLFEKLSADIGFEAEEVLYARATVPAGRYTAEAERQTLLRELESSLTALPGIDRVATMSQSLPSGPAMFGELEIEGATSATMDEAAFYGPRVSPDYFQVVGQPILRGRSFEPRDVLGTENVVVLGEHTARMLFPDRDPIGIRFRVSKTWYRAIGIVTDVPMRGLGRDPVMQVYQPLREHSEALTLAARLVPGTSRAASVAATENVLQSAGADLDVAARPAMELLESSLGRQRFALTMLTSFAGLALLLSAIGLYGAVTNLVGQRTRELGVRMALGARTGDVFRLVMRGVVYCTVAGVVAGAALVLAGGRAVDATAFGREAVHSSTYVIATLVLAATTLVGAALPAWRATRVEPVEAIRN